MADLAFGANCAACGTLVACSGSFSDEQLTGECPVCKVSVATANREYVAPQVAADAAPIGEEVIEEPEVIPVPEIIAEPAVEQQAPVEETVIAPEAEGA